MIILILAAVVIAGVVALFIFGTQKSGTQLSGNLSFWGVFDDSATMQPLIDSYKALHPKAKIEITYTEVDSDTYEQKLVDSLAGTNPPDMFMFHNTWLPKHVNKIFPISADAMSLASFKNLFPTVAQQDFAPDNAVYALPLYIDTLAMFYNQDIFDNKGIALPPKTWEEFAKIVPKIREVDKFGRITKAAAALGGSNKSINRATDILNLLMLQSGTEMVASDFSAATFDSSQGERALNFYTSFANSRDPLYTWNESLPYSLDSFAAGETAIMFNYSHQIGFLKEKSPFLKFRVAPMLQPESRQQDVNFANYWGLAVSNKTQNQALAQDFILYMTTNADASKKYLELSGRPPALRSLISQYAATQPDLGIFANQALTARSWPEVDNAAVDSIFSGMIANVIANRLPANRALSEAASKVTDLMQRRAR